MTGITLHESTKSHVSFIILAKSDHVATVVASLDLQVGPVSVLRLHLRYQQWNEDSNAHSQKCSKNLAKADLQDSIKPVLNWFFQNET